MINARSVAVVLAIAVLLLWAVLPARQVFTGTAGARERSPTGDAQLKSPSSVETKTQPTNLPSRPEAIQFEPLSFEPPDAATYRRELPDGTVVYLAESHEFPLVTLSLTFKGGASLDPPNLPGLAAMTARMIREGGTVTKQPVEIDDALDFLATEVSVSASDTFTTASMNCLTSTLDESLEIFVDMLRAPGFDQNRLETAKARLLETLKQRNDDASTILSREWRSLLYGDHFEAREPTGDSVAAISQSSLGDLHARLFHPGNVIVSGSGDLDPDAMLVKLAKAFAGWDRGERAPDPSPPTTTIKPGLYHVPKAIPQGKVAIGARSIERDDPDAIALMLLNDILGGGGFTSRIMQQVRSNEGLAYSAASRIAPKVDYPGEFRAGFESKNPTVALATKIVLDQI
ncbi:MAG: M16 family metallopeptidase, partial [Planctomycetaceae bacterium]